MKIARIELVNFRNLSSQVVEPHPQLNVIAGENAQGKTNLLEAIYMVASLRSFRARSSQELIRFGEEQARVRAKIERQEQQLELEVQLFGNRKRALVDGKALRSLSGYLGKLNAVLFTPEELLLPRGAPAERRRLIDQAISAVWPAYLELTRNYQKVLLTRNRLLRERPARLEQLLEVYEQQLSELGGRIIAGRVRYLRSISLLVGQTFSEVFRGGHKVELAYLSEVGCVDAAGELGELGRLLKRQLEQHRAQDLARQTTTSGPHSDDIEFRLDERSCRSFGSQGQVRALVLAFKIAQILYTFEKTGAYPALLLDDVSSELDSQRNKHLFDILVKIPTQLFITTARGELLPLRENYQYFEIFNGIITRQTRR